MAKKLVVRRNSFLVLYCQLHFSPFLHHTLPPDRDPAASFVHEFVAISEFKLELQSQNAQFGSKSTIF